jgi:hypothetical protein
LDLALEHFVNHSLIQRIKGKESPRDDYYKIHPILQQVLIAMLDEITKRWSIERTREVLRLAIYTEEKHLTPSSKKMYLAHLNRLEQLIQDHELPPLNLKPLKTLCSDASPEISTVLPSSPTKEKQICFLFLDLDGVFKDINESSLDAQAIRYLHDLIDYIEEAGMEPRIVLSSSHRRNGLRHKL